MPKMTISGEGYKVSVETDTEVKLKILKSLLKDVFKKENIPHDEIKTEGAENESKLNEQLPPKTASQSLCGQNP